MVTVFQTKTGGTNKQEDGVGKETVTPVSPIVSGVVFIAPPMETAHTTVTIMRPQFLIIKQLLLLQT